MAGIAEVIAKNIEHLKDFPEEFAKEFVVRVKEKTPVRTGNLQRGWDYEVQPNDVYIFNPVDYASYVEYGTDRFEGRYMLERTLLEIDDITNVVCDRLESK
jgi:hypothetical protein